MTSNYPHNFHISWFQIDNCVLQRPQSILLFESIRVLWMLLYPASQPNHISFRKLYFNEFVANVLHDHFCFGSQKHHVSVHTLALQLNVCFISQCQFCLPNIHQEMRSDITLSLHISNSRTEPAGLDFFLCKYYCCC